MWKISKFSLSKALLSIYLIASIALFLVPDGLLRAAILALIVGTALCVFLCFEKGMLWMIVVLIIMTLLSFVILNKLIFDKSVHVTVLLNLIASLFVAYALSMRQKLLSVFFIGFYILVISLLLLILLGLDANHIFSGSRNTISMILVCLGSIFLLANYGKGQRLDILLYALVFLCCILAVGRSGIIASFILLISVAFKYWKPFTYGKLFMGLLLVILFSSFVIYVYEYTSYFYYIKNKGLADSYRTRMLFEYLNSLGPGNLFFGTELSKLPYISSFNSNPHNTFLLLHSQYGILFLIFLFCIIIFTSGLIVKKLFVEALAFFALALRLATDSSVDITTLPLVFCFVCLMGGKFRGSWAYSKF
ncbi:hypothetical protein RE432_06315 [Pusillimonas sp. SM2304]|uniref:hypothetical protein n=1 Tax=Pusillimonas sp. SM2304 TaxID=3073241 RepID=UPI00287538CC|nr:hypothetical protein [Pusillimonas sp. SM2304]MDS1140043.1 hypothetical protein [Pusillimonas sp. SM2304]